MGERKVCVAVLNGETVKNEDFSRIEFKRDRESIRDDAEAEPCTKKQERGDLFDTGLVSCANKQFKEASNDEIFSEVSNPNLSPRDNACSQTISSQLAELVSNDQVGEMASTCSGNSSTESPSEEEQSKNGTLGAVSASHFVVEIPKHVSSTGIRKITFKFGKRKEDYDNQLSNTTVQSMADGVCDSDMVKAEEKHDVNKVPAMNPSTISGEVMEDDLCSSFVQNFAFKQQTCTKETLKWRKLVAKKPSFHFSSSVVQQKRTADGCAKKRDNDLHRLLFMPNGLPDGTELAYYGKGQRILGGYKQGKGIVCSCCDTEISPSQFEAHAGWSARRQPYRNIYTSNGLALHDIALSLASGQNLATGSSNDVCAVCGNGGDLIICRGCPQAFHAVCLDFQCTPIGDRYCPYCRDKFGPGRKSVGVSSNTGRPIIIRLTRVVKAPESETGGCVVCRAHDFSVAKFDDRTVMLCDQCEREYHVGCLRESGLCNLKEFPKDKWFCCEDCNRIHVALQNLVLVGAQTIPASVLNTVNKKHVEKGFTDGFSNDIQWWILSGKSRYPEHLPVLSRAAAIFRECFDPIVATSGRDLIPVMVYGRNISGQEFGGMYCVVLVVKSVVVSAGLLRIFGHEVAELPLVATSRENQGKGYFQALFSCIEMLLYSLEVENLVLPAAEDAESIWTRKLGFRKMSEERLLKYTREVQLTMFKGTSMLEKEVQQVAD
ncbi:uncharacterized protein LOC130759478 [Actinidia eriantha]|uniref:uncharacterized protein LOC130759478 n=1 Tax=Actinidia eriantha TaxID=165200 RepID=UPI0025887201|nr:uncharacterized protein LOC130759478 [Actinidia eriantha]